MTILVPLALFGWIPVVLFLFFVLPQRRAVIISFLLAWMFLPTTGYRIVGMPDYTKVSATSIGVLLALALFHLRSLTSLRFRWLDIPMIIWCLCPFASSIANGLGVYDGVSAVVGQIIKWGVPYVIGRACLTNPPDFRELAILLFAGGLIYVPFSVWEIRMSPNLNAYIYGFGGAGTSYFNELGGWGNRPRVFMGDALAAGMFMTAASLAGVWMWATGSLKRLWGMRAGPLVLLLVLTAIGCKNMGALSLLVFGLAVLFAAKLFLTRGPIYLLIMASPLFLVARIAGDWSAEAMVDAAGLIHHTRAESLQWRVDMDNLLIDKAFERPVFGWGGWGRSRVYCESDGRDIVTTDGLWIITFGTTGLVGLAAMTCTFLLAPLLVCRRYAPHLWMHPDVAPVVTLAVLIVLYMIDNLFNAMPNPIYLVALGGLVSLLTAGADPKPSCILLQKRGTLQLNELKQEAL